MLPMIYPQGTKSSALLSSLIERNSQDQQPLLMSAWKAGNRPCVLLGSWNKNIQTLSKNNFVYHFFFITPALLLQLQSTTELNAIFVHFP